MYEKTTKTYQLESNRSLLSIQSINSFLYEFATDFIILSDVTKLAIKSG